MLADDTMTLLEYGFGLNVRQLHSAVHITPVSDLDDNDDRLRVVDRIENSVMPLTDTKLLLA